MPARQSQHAALGWRKSSASNNATECVEVACRGPSVLVRDSRHPERVLAVSAAEWSVFLHGIKHDERIPWSE
jgi:hypothetical protein